MVDGLSPPTSVVYGFAGFTVVRAEPIPSPQECYAQH